MDDRCEFLPIESLREPTTLLRLVDRDSIEYYELRDSLRGSGFLNSISVRPATYEPDRYEIIDGLYRFTAAKELDIRLIPCIIKYHVKDDDVLARQIEANALRPETTPAEFAQQMKRLLMRKPEMTLADLGCLIHKSSKWVSERLGLVKLAADVQRVVDRGEIPLQSAYMLAKMPHMLQRQYLRDARTMNSKEFRALAANIIKQFTESVRQGKLDAFFTETFVPQAHLRDLRMLQQELSEHLVGPLVTTAENCKTPLDGFYCALRWASHQDRQSIREQEVAFQERQRIRNMTDVGLD